MKLQQPWSRIQQIGDVMKKTMCTVILLLATSAHTALASYESEVKTNIVEIECKGTSNGISLNAFVWADPKGLKAQLVRLDISVAVSKWSVANAVDEFYGEDVNEKGSYIGVVGEIEKGKGSYEMSIPKFKMSEVGEFQEFSAAIGLRSEFYQGKTSLKCKALFKQVKTKTLSDIRW
jgi:hypothetical protein